MMRRMLWKYGAQDDHFPARLGWFMIFSSWDAHSDSEPGWLYFSVERGPLESTGRPAETNRIIAVRMALSPLPRALVAIPIGELAIRKGPPPSRWRSPRSGRRPSLSRWAPSPSRRAPPRSRSEPPDPNGALRHPDGGDAHPDRGAPLEMAMAPSQIGGSAI